MGDMFDFNLLRPESVRPLKRTEFEALIEQGIFEDENVELIHGFLIHVSPQGEEHSNSVARLHKILVLALGDRAGVRGHSSFAASDDSMPEPDISVLPPLDTVVGRHTRAFLLVEASASSLAQDRKIKAPLYATAGVPEYWILDLEVRVIEVYRDPEPGGYRSVERFGADATIALSAFPDVRVSVAAVLPRR